MDSGALVATAWRRPLVRQSPVMHTPGMAVSKRPLGRRTQPQLSAVHALHVAELVADWKVSADALLAEFGLSRESLSEPGARLPLSTFEQLIGRVRQLTGEPGIGFHLGLKMRISAYGYLGFAAMTAADLRGALELACRFAPTLSSVIALRLTAEGGLASLVIDEVGPLGTARETVIIALIVGLWRIGVSLTGVELAVKADFAFPEPDYFSRFAALAPAEIGFSMPVHRLSFDARLLELPLLLADPAALRLAREYCERELDSLRQQTLAARVESLLVQHGGRQHSLEQVAERSHTSVRTLERKLREQGTSYSKLRDQARRDAALELLGTELSIEEIASRLGYSDATNFTRAFRRWTGESPSAHRAAARGSPGPRPSRPQGSRRQRSTGRGVK
jgi:AraC-like DNA-binding protein